MSKSFLIEKDHQLEKLEFALAVSQSSGDKIRSDQIKDQIAKIGLNFVEPGTWLGLNFTCTCLFQIR